MVEDDTLNSAIIRTILRQNGADVPFDHWGDKMLTSMSKYQDTLDLILLDLMLPGNVTGHDIFEEIQKSPGLSIVPVVAVSASDADVEIPRTKSMGFAGYISKPIKRRDFPRQILAILNGESIWGS